MKRILLGCFLIGCLFAGGPTALAQRALATTEVIGSTPDQPIAGVPSGTAPWVVKSGSLSITADGKIQGKIKGLIIPGVGVGPVTKVAASVVCGGSGGVVVATTSSFALKANGNVTIADSLQLPNSCLAPIVLLQITALNGEDLPNPINYIASSGFITNTANAQNSVQESKDGGPNN